MKLIHLQVKMEEIDIAFTLLKDAALWLREKKIDYWQNWLNPPEEHRQWILEGFRKNEFYFVKKEEELIGMYRLQYSDEMFWGQRPDSSGYIHSFTTKREYYGHGIGTHILQDIEKMLKAKGIEYLRLDCGMNIKGLCRYYEKYGFKNTGQIELDGFKMNLYEKKVF